MTAASIPTSPRLKALRANALMFYRGEVLADFERDLIREVHDRIVLRTGVATVSELQVIEDALAAMDAAGRQDLTDVGLAA